MAGHYASVFYEDAAKERADDSVKYQQETAALKTIILSRQGTWRWAFAAYLLFMRGVTKQNDRMAGTASVTANGIRIQDPQADWFR